MTISEHQESFLHTVGEAEGETFDIAGAHLTWKAKGSDTDNAFAVCEQRLNIGDAVPLHSHPYAEVFFVISGPVQFYRRKTGDGDWVTCETGSTVVIPANAIHGFCNGGSQVCRLLGISTYLHQQFFDAVKEADTQGEFAGRDQKQVMETIAAIGAHHKMYFLPPPNSPAND